MAEHDTYVLRRGVPNVVCLGPTPEADRNQKTADPNETCFYDFYGLRTYCGDKTGRVPHGVGTGCFPDLSSYVGQWRRGFADGKGTLYMRWGVYEGDFHTGRPHGIGTLNVVGGGMYEGHWTHGIPKGRVTFIDVSPGSQHYFPEAHNLKIEWVAPAPDTNSGLLQMTILETGGIA